MKKLIVVIICSGAILAARAQHGHTVVTGAYHVPYYVYQPRVIVRTGFYSPFYNPFGYYGFPYWGFAYGGYFPSPNIYTGLSKLQRKKEDIQSDYADRIYSVRQDNSLTNKQKRQEIRSLKKQRDQEIQDLVANYHKQPVSN